MGKSHMELLLGLHEQLQDVFNKSSQGVYLFLDDKNIACNDKFAKLLGYSSGKEWASYKGSFPLVFVAEGSRHTLVDAYRTAMEKKAGSQIEVVWAKKTGGIVKTRVILVPVAFEGHLFALHFVEKL